MVSTALAALLFAQLCNPTGYGTPEAPNCFCCLSLKNQVVCEEGTGPEGHDDLCCTTSALLLPGSVCSGQCSACCSGQHKLGTIGAYICCANHQQWCDPTKPAANQCCDATDHCANNACCQPAWTGSCSTDADCCNGRCFTDAGPGGSRCGCSAVGAYCFNGLDCCEPAWEDCVNNKGCIDTVNGRAQLAHCGFPSDCCSGHCVNTWCVP